MLFSSRITKIVVGIFLIVAWIVLVSLTSDPAIHSDTTLRDVVECAANCFVGE